jgi:hypothetical protein
VHQAATPHPTSIKHCLRDIASGSALQQGGPTRLVSLLRVYPADVEARSAEASELNERGAYITPRALMSILRLSQVGRLGG